MVGPRPYPSPHGGEGYGALLNAVRLGEVGRGGRTLAVLYPPQPAPCSFRAKSRNLLGVSRLRSKRTEVEKNPQAIARYAAVGRGREDARCPTPAPPVISAPGSFPSFTRHIRPRAPHGRPPNVTRIFHKRYGRSLRSFACTSHGRMRNILSASRTKIS